MLLEDTCRETDSFSLLKTLYDEIISIPVRAGAGLEGLFIRMYVKHLLLTMAELQSVVAHY